MNPPPILREGQPDEEIVVCHECSYPCRMEEYRRASRCPNPACFPGLRAYGAARSAWERARDAYVTAAQARTRYLNPRAAEEWFERDNPRPQARDYEVRA